MEGFEAGQIEAAPRRRRARRLSEVFANLAHEAEGRVTVASIRDALGDRSFAALLVIFAAVNLLPLPPGATFILGLPLLIVSAQMMYGSKRAWLPRFLLSKSVSAEQFRALMARVVPRLVQLEKLIRPRYWPFWRRRGDRVIGTIAFVMAVILTLPIPFNNWLPAFSTALLGLSLTERDGIFFAVGGVVGVGALAVTVAFFGAINAAAHVVLAWMV